MENSLETIHEETELSSTIAKQSMLNSMNIEALQQSENQNKSETVPVEIPVEVPVEVPSQVEMDSTIPLSTPSQNTMVDFRKELQNLVFYSFEY